MFVWRVLSMTADGTVWFPLPPAVSVVSFLAYGSPYVLLPSHPLPMYIGITLCAAVELTIKPIVGRARPPLPVNDKARFIAAENFSFPSGHTLRAFFVALFAINHWGVHPLLGLSWATVVGVARAQLGRHYLSDCFGGAILGSILYGLFTCVY